MGIPTAKVDGPRSPCPIDGAAVGNGVGVEGSLKGYSLSLSLSLPAAGAADGAADGPEPDGAGELLLDGAYI